MISVFKVRVLEEYMLLDGSLILVKALYKI